MTHAQRTSRKRRWWRLIALHLVLGLVLNVVVAVAASFLPDPWYQPRTLCAANEDGPGFCEARRFGSSVLWYVETQGRFAERFARSMDCRVVERRLPRWAEGPIYTEAEQARRDEWVTTGMGFNLVASPPPVSTWEMARGWPMRCLSGAANVLTPTQVGSRRWCVTIAVRTRPSLVVYKPLPLGLAVNTLVFGAMTFTAAESWRALRRWRRVKRGRCVACGYELAEFTQCPECGLKR